MKPWTWMCGQVSGIVKGGFFFYDNAVFTKSNELYVVGNLRILETSAVRFKEGGKLIIGEELDNNSIIISDKSFILDVGYMKQGRNCSVVSNQDLLLSLRKEFSDIWFGYIYADVHLFIQVQERVACDADCVSKEVDVEFFGESPQFVMTENLVAEEGSLSLKSETKCESANFVLTGRLSAHGIDGETATVCVLPGGKIALTPPRANMNGVEINMNEADVITRWLKVSNQAVVEIAQKHNEESTVCENSKLSTNIYCKESLMVDGTLIAFGSYLTSYSETLSNSGLIKLFTSDPSSSLLKIKCDEEVSNSGIIESTGNVIIEANVVSNERGVIKSSPCLHIVMYDIGATSLGGKIIIDKSLFIHSQTQEELLLSMVGGKRDNDEHFVLSGQLEVKCNKGHLKLNSSIVCTDEQQEQVEESNMVLNLHKYLIVLSDCELHDVRVIFVRTEDNNNNTEENSKFVIQDSLKVKSLRLRSDPNISEKVQDLNIFEKEKILFEGSNKTTTIDTLVVDQSIKEVEFATKNRFVCTKAVLCCEVATIKTDLECVVVAANNLSVLGRMGLKGEKSEEIESLVDVEYIAMVHGTVECFGHVKVSVGESFVQAENGSLVVEEELQIEVANENSHGMVLLEGSTKGQAESVVKVGGGNIKVTGSFSEVQNLTLDASMDMTLSEKSTISCEEINMEGEWIKTAGVIKGFHTLIIKSWAVMNSGYIDSENEASSISLTSDLALINGGICRAQTTYLEAPFLLSLPGEPVSDVSDITRCEMLGRENLKLESIACFLGGSSILSCKRYENISVLLFKFLTYVSCTPDSKSLKAWSKAAESLKSIQSQVTTDAEKQDSKKLRTLMKDMRKGTEVDLRIAQMYNMVNDFVAEILKNGIKSFDTAKLVYILTIESERYTKINILKEKLLQIPEEAKILRRLAKKNKKKELQVIRKKLGFSDPKMLSQQKEGIFESGFYSFGEGVIVTDSVYEAALVEVYSDQGFIMAVDFLPSTMDVVLSKREKKAVALAVYAETLRMENIDAEQVIAKADEAKLNKVKSNVFDVEAKQSIDAENIKGNKVVMESKDLKISTLDAKNTNLSATSSALLKNIDSDNLNINSGRPIDAENIKGDRVSMESMDLSVSNLDAKNTNLSSSNNTNVRNVKSRNLTVIGGGSVDAENIRGSNIQIQGKEEVLVKNVSGQTVGAKSLAGSVRATNINSSEETVIIGAKDVKVGGINSKTAVIKASRGQVNATGKIQTNKAFIESKKGINLAYNKNGKKTADHRFNSLQMKTNKINQVHDLLKEDGIYKDLKICDQLGLVVSDQDVILSSCVFQQDYKLNLEARSVNVDNAYLNWQKGASITSSTSMNVNDAFISAEESISLTSKMGNVSINSSGVQAGKIAKIEASNGSVSLTGSSISGDEAGIVKAKQDVIARPRGFFSSSDKSCSYSTVTKSRIASSKGNVTVVAEEGKSQAIATEFNAAKDLKIIGTKGVDVQDLITIPEQVSVKNNWFRKSTVRRPEHHKSSLNGDCQYIKGKNINMIGTSCNTKGDMIFDADETISIQERILSSSEQTRSSGISFSAKKGLSIEAYTNREQNQQTLAGSKLQAGRNLAITGKNVSVTNAMEMDVGNLFVGAENVMFKGAKLNNSYSDSDYSVSIGLKSIEFTAEQGFEKQKNIQNQNINVRGETKLLNCKKATLDTSNLNTGQISGNVEKFHVISRLTEVEADKKSGAIGFPVCKGYPVPNKFGMSQSSDQGKFVKKSAGIHVRDSIKSNEFKVDNLYLKGSAVTANGDVAKFAQNIIKEKVKSYQSLTAYGLNMGIDKTSVEFGAYQSEMQRNATIGSFFGTVSHEIQQSVNTNLSKHYQETKSQSSNVGLNVSVGKEGCAASMQVDDVGCGFSARKDEIGIQAQSGDKGFGLSAGSSDASLSLQNGKSSLGVGLTNQGMSFNARFADTAIGTSVGENGVSATVISKDFSISGSSINGSTSVQTNVGDFKGGISTNKDSETGERSTSTHISHGEFGISATSSKQSQCFSINAGELGIGFQKSKATSEQPVYSGNIKAREFEIQGSSSKNQKSIELKVADFQTQMNVHNDSETAESMYDANLKAGDFGIEASSSQNNKSIGIEAGDFKTNIKQGKDSKTGKSTYDANLKAGDFGIEASASDSNKSIGVKAGDFKANMTQGKDSKTGKSTYDANVKAGDFKANIKQEKDSKTGKSTYDANVKAGNFGIEASASDSNKSIGVKAGDFKTNIKQGKDSKTGKSTYDANLKAGDFGIEASSSQNNKSIGIEAGNFKANIKQGKDSKTGKSTYDANLKAGDFGIEASASDSNKSIGVKAGNFKTNIKQGKDSKTGKSTYDANLKAGDFGIEASSSQNNKSIGIEAGNFKANIKQGKDSKTGKSTYDANLKAGDFGIEVSASDSNKSIGVKAGNFKTNIKQGKDSKTGKSTYDANLKAGDFGIEASASDSNKSIGVKAGNFKTNIKQGKDSKTGKSTYDANLKAGDFGIEVSASDSNKSIGVKAGNFKTNIKQGKDSKTGKSTYDANLKAGDFGIEASASDSNKSIGVKAGNFKTNIKQGKDSKTGKSTYDANLKAGDFGIEASASDSNKSIGVKAGDFKTNIKQGKDSKTGKSTYDANLKAGDFGIEASSSQNNKSIGIEAGNFKANIKQGKDSKTGKSTYDANLKAGDFGIEASASDSNKSIGVKAGNFKTNIKQGKDSKTGKSTYDANLKAGDFGIEASSSQNNKSIGIEAGDFKTNITQGKDSKTGKSTYGANVKAGDFKANFKQGKDSKTGKSTYDANLKAGDFGIEASASDSNKSIGVKAGYFKANIKQGKDSKTGISTYDANVNAGDFGIEASSSKNNKSIGIEAGDFKTNITQGKDSKTGKSTYDANLKARDFGIEASSSENNKSIGIEAGDFKTNITQGKDSKTGKSTYDANLKAGDFGIEASASDSNKSIGIEARNFKTNITQEKDSKTGKSTYDVNLKAGDFGIEASASDSNICIGVKAGDFKTNITQGKDSKTGKSTYGANVKAGDFGMEASSSDSNHSIGVKAGDFKPNIRHGKESKTGKSTYDANLKVGDFAIEEF